MRSVILTPRLVARFRQGDHEAYEIVFNAYYLTLCLFASKMIGDQYDAEDVVEDVFVKLWEKHAALTLTEPYLHTMVINGCLDHISHRIVVRKAAKELMYTTTPTVEPLQHIQHCQITAFLEKDVYEAMRKMSPSVREVFRLAFEKKLKTKEIAAIRNLSVKTVQLQLRMAIAIVSAHVSRG